MLKSSMGYEIDVANRRIRRIEKKHRSVVEIRLGRFFAWLIFGVILFALASVSPMLSVLLLGIFLAVKLAR